MSNSMNGREFHRIMTELSELFLMVTDVEQTTAFYEDLIGLTVTHRGSSVRFDAGGTTVVIEEDFDREILAQYGLEPPGDNRGDGAIFVIDVDDPDAVYERVAESAGDALMEPTEVEWGRRMALVADPDGYVLEVSRPLED